MSEQLWISVDERLPEMKPLYRDGPKQARVIVFTGNYVCDGILEETYSKRKLSWKYASGHCIRATHWMPLPEPPVEHAPKVQA